MKRLAIILFSLLSIAMCIEGETKKTLYLVDTDGNMQALSIASVDSLTFKAKNVFAITTGKPLPDYVTESTFQATANVALSENVKELTAPSDVEVGVCYSAVTPNPTIADSHNSLGTGKGDYTISIDGLTSGTTYYYRTYAKLLNEVFYGNVMTVRTITIINGHKFVDLGLTSSLLWAMTNVGADAATDSGDHFAWGETKTKDKYYWDTYEHGTSSSNITKYSTADGLTTLDADDDAATAVWGEGCRMPSLAECEELVTECTWTWQDDNDGASGYKVTGPNGFSIFLPAAGYKSMTGSYGSGNGYYWTSSLNSNDSYGDYYANNITFNSADYKATPYYRYYGYSIRPVATK